MAPSSRLVPSRLQGKCKTAKMLFNHVARKTSVSLHVGESRLPAKLGADFADGGQDLFFR